MEWKAVKRNCPDATYQKSPWGEYFYKDEAGQRVLFFHEGWGKVAAAGATQYVIDEFKPDVLINLGTCGGFEGAIERGQIVLANETVIYDIKEAMGDSKAAIDDYKMQIDLSWVGGDFPYAKKSVLVSADKDLEPAEIEKLKSTYGAAAGDWESGAIAYTAVRNHKKIVILRGVTDLVSISGSETYGNFDLFAARADSVMTDLLKKLPDWITYLEHQ
jgi:adenosylhomocysteine nucleosidase